MKTTSFTLLRSILNLLREKLGYERTELSTRHLEARACIRHVSSGPIDVYSHAHFHIGTHSHGYLQEIMIIDVTLNSDHLT